jgi:hypothetical protein
MNRKNNLLPILVPILLVVVGVAGYIFSQKSLNFSPNPPKEVSVVEEPPKPQEPEILPLTYSKITLLTDQPGKEVTDVVGFENLETVLSLNRIDQKHFQKGMTIVYPSRYDDLFALSSFPRNVPELSTTPKIIFVAQGIQEFGVYEYGTLVRFGGISTGKKSTPTPNGLFHTNWKGKEVISTSNDEWILKWNFNIDNLDGIGIHEYELPGYPASHSCIRFSAKDAEWFYNWADQWVLSEDGNQIIQKGTPVIVFGQYPFGELAPWKKLAENPYQMTLSVEDIKKELLQHPLSL